MENIGTSANGKFIIREFPQDASQDDSVFLSKNLLFPLQNWMHWLKSSYKLFAVRACCWLKKNCKINSLEEGIPDEANM